MSFFQSLNKWVYIKYFSSLYSHATFLVTQILLNGFPWQIYHYIHKPFKTNYVFHVHHYDPRSSSTKCLVIDFLAFIYYCYRSLELFHWLSYTLLTLSVINYQSTLPISAYGHDGYICSAKTSRDSLY